MARPRTPLQSLTPGTISNQASRIVNRAREPKTAGKLGLASQWLSAEQQKIWKRLVKFTPAVLGESDRMLLEIANRQSHHERCMESRLQRRRRRAVPSDPAHASAGGIPGLSHYVPQTGDRSRSAQYGSRNL